MSALDWGVMLATIVGIVAWGVWRTRHVRTAEGFLRGSGELPWYAVGLSVMATQASAITFLSTPGQGFDDGLRFVQFYFGLPIAMVLLSAVVVPRYFRLKVYTAYEFLEGRYDRRTRQLAALLFLVQRGLAAGITIYAPAIILSTLLGWPLDATNLAIGLVVVLYTVLGGTQAVSHTQKHQMVVMLGGMVVALVLVVVELPESVSFGDAVAVAGAFGRLNAIDTSLDPANRYTLWSGLTGGLFLALAYFGTDQSQVQRYLSGRSIAQARLGLLFNGLLKVPMQLVILFIGVMVFVFYQFERPPLFFHEATRERVAATEHAGEWAALEAAHDQTFAAKRAAVQGFLAARDTGDDGAQSAARAELRTLHQRAGELRAEGRRVIAVALPGAETKDTDYVFLGFVLGYLPAGLVGLLVAVILTAAMSSTAGELSALGTTTTMDLWRRSFRPDATDRQTLVASKLFTVGWGFLAIAFATFASLIDNLIQAVNILGSLFYGTVLGIFLAAFFLKRTTGAAVFWSALAAEAVVLALFFATDVGFLWYNVVGCGGVLLLSSLGSLRPARA
jgi:SSS family transporter